MNLFYKTAITGCLLLITLSMRAQVIMHIGSGGKVYIAAKTAVSFDSLVMLPSSKGLLLGENNISKLTTPNNPFSGAYLKRVYCFSKPVAGFSGSLGIFYNENEAAGIDVNKLLIQAYTGYAWHPQRDIKARNAQRNAVGVLDVHRLDFSELLAGYTLKDWMNNPGSLLAPIALAPTTGTDVSLSVYPNPAVSVVNIQVNGSTPVKSLQLYDAAGKLLMTKTGSKSNRYEFTVSSLPAGMYRILVETESGKQVKAFVKQ